MKKDITTAEASDQEAWPDSRQPYESRRLDQIAARWDAKAPTWDAELQSPLCHLNEDEAYPRFVRDTRDLILSRRDFCAPCGLIDAGCGTGLVLGELVAFFAWAIGVDISPAMIARAKAKNLPKANFIVGDCFRLSDLCAPAGAIISRGVLLSHYGHRVGVPLLAAAHAALVPGGFAVFDFLSQAGRPRAIHAPGNKQYFSRSEVVALGQSAGFGKVTILGTEERRVLLMVGENT